MPTTREAQLVQLWTKPDTIRDHKPLWCFLVLDYQGFPFLSNCCISHETMRLCPKSLRVSCPVWHKHSAFFLYLQKQLPPHCVLSSMECVFGSHFSFAAATHFWAFFGGYVDMVWDEKNTNATPNSCYANMKILKHQLKSHKWLFFLFLPFFIHHPLDFAFSIPVPLSFSSKLGSQLVLYCCAY